MIDFNHFRMMLLREYGLQDRENSRLYTKKPRCTGGGGKFVTASLVDIRSALIILAYGYLVSIVLLSVERFVSIYISKNPEKKKLGN